MRNFSYTVVDDKIYYRENSRMTPVGVSATAENRIKGMIAIRNSVRTLIELQTEDYPDSEIKAEQERLNRLYDTFSGKYGLINSRANTSAFSQDSSFSLLSALEIIGEDGELERKQSEELSVIAMMSSFCTVMNLMCYFLILAVTRLDIHLQQECVKLE